MLVQAVAITILMLLGFAAAGTGPDVVHSGYNRAGNYYENYADGSWAYSNLDGTYYYYDATVDRSFYRGR
jgi:hypothetical protein